MSTSGADAHPLHVVSEWPVTTAAVSVDTEDGEVASVGPADLVLPWASVTKMLSALVVLDAARQGEIDLDEPAGPPGSTVRHLLAHASGVGPDSATPLAAPGRSRIYSNAGYDILGALVEERCGTSFDARMRSRICRPLGMTATRLVGSPASAVEGPLRDLAAFGRELLRPRVLPADIVALASNPAFSGLSGVLPGFGRQARNEWGLGFEIRDGKRPHWTGAGNSASTFGHFGRSGTFLWVDPAAGLACACLTDREFGPWAAEVWPVLSDAVLHAYAPTGRPRGG